MLPSIITVARVQLLTEDNVNKDSGLRKYGKVKNPLQFKATGLFKPGISGTISGNHVYMTSFVKYRLHLVGDVTPNVTSI